MRTWRTPRPISRLLQTTARSSRIIPRSCRPFSRALSSPVPERDFSTRRTRTRRGENTPPQNPFCFVCGRLMPNKQPRTPPSTPPKYCSQHCRRQTLKPSSDLDSTIVDIFLAKLKEAHPMKTGVMCDEVADAVPSGLEITPERPEALLSPPQDLRERVRCVARRSIVLGTQGGIKGRLEAVEAVTLQGRPISAEQLSSFKGDFGLRRREV